MLKYLILTVLPFFFMYKLGDTEFDSNFIQNKINNSLDNNFSYSLEMLPYFNNENTDYLKYYEIIDYINNRHHNLTILERPKIEIKINTLSNEKSKMWIIFKSIIDYAYHKNVFIWISPVIPKTLKMEYEFFLKCRELNYTNLGITLAAYNKNIHNRVDNILSNNGTINLIKGFYYGDIKDWQIVTDNYYMNAEKMIKSGNYHALSTHDFEILGYLKNKYPEEFQNIELVFFNEKNLEKINEIKNNTKSFYISFGKVKSYIMDNIFIMNTKNY